MEGNAFTYLGIFAADGLSPIYFSGAKTPRENYCIYFSIHFQTS